MDDQLRAGLERQLERLEAHRARGEQLGGWKVGLTSGRARDAMGAGFRPFGYILASRILSSPATVPVAALSRGAVENELCFTLRTALNGSPDRAEVIAALAAVAPAFEVVEDRLPATASAAERLADDLSQWGIVVGEPCRPDGDLDFSALRVTLSLDGAPVESVAAAGHIDDHVESMAALVRLLDDFGLGLRAGERVITGSYTRQPIEGPGTWTGDFGPDLGTVTLSLT